MGNSGDTDEDAALKRDIIAETLEECERLLAAAEADAAELRQMAQRHAQERAEGTARAMTATSEWLHQAAAADRAAAREARDRADLQLEEAERLRGQIAAELQAATTARREAEAALTSAHAEVQRLTALAEARLGEAATLQEELEAERIAGAASHDLAADREATERRLEAEMAERLAEAERSAEERLAQAEVVAAARLAAVDGEIELLTRQRRAEAETSSAALLDDARRMAAKLLGDAERQASKQLADANTAAGALLADAQQQATELVQAAETQRRETDTAAATGDDARSVDVDIEWTSRLAAADRAANDRLAKADAEVNRQLLDALEEARRIVTDAKTEASEIRARAEARARPREDGDRDADAGEHAGGPPDLRDTGTGQRRRARWQRHVHLLGFVVAVLVAAALVRTLVAEPYTVALSSMEPALSDGDRLMLNKLAYDVGDPVRGDVIVFDTDEVPGAAGAPSRTLVKRVVGLPGEVVQGLDDQLVVDDELIDDPWHGATPTPAFGPILVPEGMLFVLGDNRALSVDSRTFGAVPIEVVIGRVEAVIWPPDQVGRV